MNLDIIGESTKTTLNPHATRTSAGTDVGHSSIGSWARISGTWIAPPEDGREPESGWPWVRRVEFVGDHAVRTMTDQQVSLFI